MPVSARLGSLAVTVSVLVALPVLARPPADAAAPPPAKTARRGTAAEAQAFVKKLDVDLRKLWVRQATADWVRSNYITGDSERNSAAMTSDLMAYTQRAILEANRFRGLKLDPQTQRMLTLLRTSSTLPAPADPTSRDKLASLAAELENMYGVAKDCGPDGKGPCRDLQQLEDVFEQSQDWDKLLAAWVGWHNAARPMKPKFTELVKFGNEGARAIGFQDLGDVWKSSYDAPPAAFEQETQRLWAQVKPLYDDLHCYVRGKLSAKYGADKVPDHGPIPAHVLGNMWAQEWGNVYSLVEPYPGEGNLDVTGALKAAHYDELRMVRLGEAFYTSMGLDPLPKTFWERSLFKKPRDREVVCHASAWDVQYDDDLRIKMCIKVNEADLTTIHHELGHDYYFHAYHTLPVLFQAGANDGFHEAIGDAITLSITPSYLNRVGLLKEVPPKDQKNLINAQLKDALEKIAFLPFGLVIDQWRWQVFSGQITPANYNQAWWDLRLKYQGVKPPVARSDADFDPGAKYHVASNTPYLRYFLARILQFQFHKALCDAAGFQGPLHECSVYGNKDAGKRFQAMLALGASRPWPDALEQLTGTRQMDAAPMLEYFKPLRAWLAEQNKGKTCGW